jgi:hypothetical protein
MKARSAVPLKDDRNFKEAFFPFEKKLDTDNAIIKIQLSADICGFRLFNLKPAKKIPTRRKPRNVEKDGLY